MAEGDFQNMSSQLQSIYRIPSSLRDLDPNAYEPQVVSIGPYHRSKEQLKPMEVFKKRAVDLFLHEDRAVDKFFLEFRSSFRSSSHPHRSSINVILAEFNRDKLENFYVGRLSDREDGRLSIAKERHNKWVVFMVELILDGCFLLELLLDRAENRAHLSYVKMDMLVLDNQIPLLVLRKLASIIAKLGSNRPSASQPTGSENVTIQIENENITKLIWEFYRTSENDEIPADVPDDANHVLEAYWRKSCIGTGAYDGWASSLSVRELYYHGVKFQPSGRSFRDVEFNVSENYFERLMGCKNHQNNQNGQEQQNHQNNESEQAQQNHQNNQNGQEQQNHQNNESEQAQQNHQNNQNGQAQR